MDGLLSIKLQALINGETLIRIEKINRERTFRTYRNTMATVNADFSRSINSTRPFIIHFDYPGRTFIYTESIPVTF